MKGFELKGFLRFVTWMWRRRAERVNALKLKTCLLYTSTARGDRAGEGEVEALGLNAQSSDFVGYPTFEIALDTLDVQESEKGTSASLVRGIDVYKRQVMVRSRSARYLPAS